jgi:hypothetical protein
VKPRIVPIPGHESLPRMFFVGMWIGARGGGKTYSCAHLLKLYEHFGLHEKGKLCDQRIILMSPTVEANMGVWKTLKHLNFDADVHGNYSDAKLVAVVNDITQEAEKTKTWCRRCDAWDRAMKARHPSHVSKKDLATLSETGMMNPREVMERPKHERPVVNFLVLDDLVGSSAFKSVGVSTLTNVVLKNRHIRLNICILVQALKSVPKSIRSNASVFVLFKFANTDIVLELHEVVSNIVTEDQFMSLYKFATEHDHGSLIIDTTQPNKEDRFKASWSQYIRF